LNAHVVDVVLHFDRRAAKPEHSHQRVAERGVAQVSHVRGLVGIDGRVLDDSFFSNRPDGCGAAFVMRATTNAGRSR